MKVLLAVDSSPASQNVISEAVSRPWCSGTVFCVLTVLDTGHWGGLATLIGDAKRDAKTLVTAARGELERSGLEVLSRIQLGVPKKAISKYAKRWGADLIMIGSRGLSALTRFLLGSVAQAVLRTATCSVEIVRPSPQGSPASSRGMKILVATDGSNCSENALCAAANRPWPAETQVKVISVREFLVLRIE
jgi:nucleotide-binding universal stress UspA family protein